MGSCSENGRSCKQGLFQRRWTITLATGFYVFMLVIEAGISCDSDIQIGPFKTPNSYTCGVLQLSWKAQSDINHFDGQNWPAICLVNTVLKDLGFF